MIGNNFANIFLCFVLLIVFACKKENVTDDFAYITDESNYTIETKKKNDTIVRISGENSQYKLIGFKNIKDNTKVGWWKIKNKRDSSLFEIEYLPYKRNKENQILFYKNGLIVDHYSQYYKVVYSDKGYYVFEFYFPPIVNKSETVDFAYLTRRNGILEDKKIQCKRERQHYRCSISVASKDQMIAGMATVFSESERNGGIVLSSSSMYAKTTSSP